MEISEENVIIKIYIRNKCNLLANATVTLKTIEYGFVVIKDFQIWKSSRFNERLQQAINITPPALMIYGTPHKRVWFEDSNSWYKIEDKIYSVFNMAVADQKNKTENVNPDEIPV